MFYITCHAVFEKIAGQFALTDYIVYQDLVMDISFYLVSYDGLQVKMTTHKVSLCLFIYVFIVFKKNKKNLADLVPACWVVFTLL